MKNLFLALAAVTLLAIQTPGSPEPAPKAVAHVYIAYRVAVARGMVIIDIDDGEGAKAVVGLPPEIIEQIIIFSRKEAISYEP